MSSVLNSSSSTFFSSKQNVTYDLTTQNGRSNFWDYILSVIPETYYPGMVACNWYGESLVYIKLSDNTEYLITGESQIWLHGGVLSNTPGSWNYLSLCIIDVTAGNIITLKLDYTGTADIRLLYSVHRRD